ncbi:MAG: hypothetical protein ACM31C_00705 [Acidobacteriota bacterium]
MTRSAFASVSRYGSTALLVICSVPEAANGTSPLFGCSQPTSSAICFDRPITTAVEHDEPT